MTILTALKKASNNRLHFRRKGGIWLEIIDYEICFVCNHLKYSLSTLDVLATDWEVKQ